MKEDVYKVTNCPDSARIKSIDLGKKALENFFNYSKDITLRDINYIPYKRLTLAHFLEQSFGKSFTNIIRQLILKRQIGGFILSIDCLTNNDTDIIKFMNGLAYLLGHPFNDVLSGNKFARLTIYGKDFTEESSNLYQPFKTFKFHTDGAASAATTTDWLAFGKTFEMHAKGGRTRLLHLDDWEKFKFFYEQPQGTKDFCFQLPGYNDPRQKQWGNHVKSELIYRPIFFNWNNQISIRFADQFIHPMTIQDAIFIKSIVESLENSSSIEYITIPVGSILFLNNNFWLHGREKFNKNTALVRELVRMRGSLTSDNNMETLNE